MVLGVVIAGVLAVAVFFVSKFVVFSDRERISASAFVSGTTCLATGGFLVSEEVGFFVTGALLVLLSLLLAYEEESDE